MPSSAAAPLRSRRPGWGAQVGLVLGKDLAIELATGEIVSTAGFFAVLVALLASLAFRSDHEPARVAPGVIWVSVSFASVLALSRSWQREREDGALTGLLALPLSRSAVFAGKALAIAAFVAVVEAVVIPVSALLFQLDLGQVGLGLVAIAAAATPGVAASGTLFGVMTARTRARDLVLATVLFPLLTPTLLAAVAATRELLGGAPLSELGDYLLIMGVFDAVFAIGGLSIFELLVEG